MTDVAEKVKETGKDLKEGAKKLPSSETLWYVGAAVAALMVGVMAMSAWFGNKPSFLPNAPAPPSYNNYYGGR